MVSKFAHSKASRHQAQTDVNGRAKILVGFVYLGLLIVGVRLFYWTILAGSPLKAAANRQYNKTITESGERGKIYTSDGYLLVGNASEYRVVAYPPLLKQDTEQINSLIMPLLLQEYQPYQQATESAVRAELADELSAKVSTALDKREAKWVSLFSYVSEELKQQLAQLNIEGLGFEDRPTRLYPEASMAAHLTGFVGRNDEGEPVGYFGIEGALNKELAGRDNKTILSTDALGFSLFGSKTPTVADTRGRDVVLTIRRDLQHVVETKLAEGMEHYGAAAGEIIIMDPKTGQILAMASQPKYDQANFADYETYLYKNPVISDTFEPGSIMKTLTVSAGIDAGKITPDTTCPVCDQPRRIGGYTIRTWNDVYNPDISMRDALAKSDNTAMIFVAEQLGVENFQTYLKKFGIGEPINIDLQEDTATPFPTKWGPVELATRSFGQGITTTSLQMMRAVSAIANQGVMMQPQIVKEVVTPTGDVISIEPTVARSVISPDTARQVAEMMVHAAKSGEAQWTYSKTHSVAAKTGTSQIPKIEGGGYQEDATLTSFIGFAPPENPKFVMLVKFVNPQSSPWAAETAAPLWYDVAEKVFLLLNIPPDQ